MNSRIVSILCRLPSAVILALLATTAAGPEPASEPVDGGPQTFTLLFENDLFGDSDQQYTNGLKLSWLSPNLKQLGGEPGVPGWLLHAVDRPTAFEHAVVGESKREFNVGFAIGQTMFTPQDTQTVRLVEDDRPYAGWLFGGLTLVSKTDQVADTVDLQFGMVGPASLAEDAQHFVHDLRDLPIPRGWENQLSNEPGFTIYYERKWRLFERELVGRFGYDTIVHAGVAAGTVMDYGAAGAEVRVGWNLPRDFGTSLIRPGGDANAPSVSGLGGRHARGFGCYGFAALGGRLVGRNMFLDGNTFEDSHSVSKKIAVGDLIIGGSVVMGAAKLSYAQVFRTREFDGQSRRHNFGSINLSLSF